MTQVSSLDHAKARSGERVMIDASTGDEWIRAADGNLFVQNGCTGNYHYVTADEWKAGVEAAHEAADRMHRRAEEDRRRAWEDEQALLVAQDAVVTALRAAFPAITDAAVETFILRYGSGWTVEVGFGLYDGYGDGADVRLAKLVAACNA